jgi:hypothetical protein
MAGEQLPVRILILALEDPQRGPVRELDQRLLASADAEEVPATVENTSKWG